MSSRPKSVLWVDDEIESLESHRRFLTDHGYEVAAAAHGDDALEMLRRRTYGVVLVDEQMPGKRGLELFGAIRSLDPAVPVVMVTKSDDPAVMREAIGMAVDDYLVKPLQPRQVLSVVTRLLEGDRIRQQHLSRQFVTRFRELEGRRGTALGWRDWIDLWQELMAWDLRLAEAREPGLEQALHTLLSGLRRDFVGFITKNYPRWIAHPEGDRPALSCDVVEEMVLPVLKEHGRVLFIVVDCLRLDQWGALLPLVTPLFDVETSHYFGILPSATPYSRNALFAGLLPRDIASHYPAWWTEREDESLNAHPRRFDLLALRPLSTSRLLSWPPVTFTASIARRYAQTRAPCRHSECVRRHRWPWTAWSASPAPASRSLGAWRRGSFHRACKLNCSKRT